MFVVAVIWYLFLFKLWLSVCKVSRLTCLWGGWGTECFRLDGPVNISKVNMFSAKLFDLPLSLAFYCHKYCNYLAKKWPLFSLSGVHTRLAAVVQWIMFHWSVWWGCKPTFWSAVLFPVNGIYPWVVSLSLCTVFSWQHTISWLFLSWLYVSLKKIYYFIILIMQPKI